MGRRSQRIAEWVKAHRGEAVELIRELVAIPSVNHPPDGNERKVQEFVSEWLSGCRAETERYEFSGEEELARHPAYMPGRNYAGRPNVAAAFRDAGGGRPLMFSSHADTVRVNEEEWTHPPFSGKVEGNRLYGRGAFDMKGGLAASMMAARCVRELGLPLKGDVIVESVVDEEYGGANGTLAARLRGVRADMAVIPEPTNLRLCAAHLGGGIWRARFRGTGGIRFSGEAVTSALVQSAAFAALLADFEDHWNAVCERPQWWDRGHRLSVIVNAIHAGAPPGEVPDTTPSQGEVAFWIEGYPGTTEERILTELSRFYEERRKRYPQLAQWPEVTRVFRYLEGSETPAGELRERFFATVPAAYGRAAGRAYEGGPEGALFVCDGFMFNRWSPTPAVILGPCGGNAHAADEWLDLDSYLMLIRWYAEIIAQWSE